MPLRARGRVLGPGRAWPGPTGGSPFSAGRPSPSPRRSRPARPWPWTTSGCTTRRGRPPVALQRSLLPSVAATDHRCRHRAPLPARAAVTSASAATGSTSSRSPAAGWPSSSATSWAAACARPRRWASCARRSGCSPSSTRCPRTSCATSTTSPRAPTRCSSPPASTPCSTRSAAPCPSRPPGTRRRCCAPPTGRPSCCRSPRAPRSASAACPSSAITVEVADGSRLLLYTDGLVESRDADIDEATAPACRRPSPDGPVGPGRALRPPARRSLGRDGGHDDDVALLVAELSGLDAAPGRRPGVLDGGVESVTQALGPGSGSGSTAWQLEPLAELAELLVSELLTNAATARDAAGSSSAALLLDEIVTLGVTDERRATCRACAGSTTTTRAAAACMLVSMLAARWGARPTADRQGRVVRPPPRAPVDSRVHLPDGTSASACLHH